MKRIILTSAFLIASVAHAGAFNGSYFGIGAGAQYNEIYDHTAGINGQYNEPTMSDTHIAGQVFAGYAIDITPSFNLGGNIFYNYGNDQSGSAINIAHKDISGKFKKNWGISIEPGYNINDKMLAYANLGYSRSDYKQNNSVGNGINDESMNGFIFGVGVKYTITNNIMLALI